MTTSSLVFIDARVSSYESLINDLPSDAEVVVLDSQTDGLEQIAARLAGRTGIEAIHVVSHGSQGALYLGNARVDGAYLTSHKAQLTSIGSGLAETGDILLYGCNVAQGDVGLQFVQSLADLTGADVAASTDITGPVALNGNAELEARIGSVQNMALNAGGLNEVLTDNTAPTFKVGNVTTDLSPYDYGQSVTVQTDGKILVAGQSYDDSKHGFALLRYTADGTLDTSFSGDGKVITVIGSNHSYGRSVALQSDGKILVAGYSQGSNSEFALVRYNTDGTLDTSFSGDGMLTTAIGSYGDVGNSVIIQADGKILVAGNSYDGSKTNFALVRYNTDGTLDTSFSGDGMLTTAIGSYGDFGNSVAVQADGKILVAGYSRGSNSDFALARYNADGTLDTSFSSDGVLITSIGSGYDFGYSMTVQTDGKILVAGASYSDYSIEDFSLARYTTDGLLDDSFGVGGLITTDLGSSGESGRNVVVQADGKILVAGFKDGSNMDFATVRYNTDGTLDTSFSSDGIATTSIGLFDDWGYSVTVQSDGKILVAGVSNDGSNSDFALIRYNNDGNIDKSFGDSLDEVVAYTGNAPVVLDSNVQIHDNELVLANNYYGSSITLARHGGANAEDVFSAVSGGSLSALTAGGYFSINGTSVGRVLVNANGTLKLGFIAGATQDLVNQTLQQIAYANTASTPPARVQMDWTFSDGNTGTQGAGGAMSVTGSTTVHITAGNVAPTVGAGLNDVRILPGNAFEYTIPAGSFSDANTGEPFVYTVMATDNSPLPPWLVFNGDTGTFSGTPGIFDEGSMELRVTATDTAGASVSDVFVLQVDSNAAPTGTVTITGTPTQGLALTIDNSLADAEGLGTMSYQWLANGQAISGATGNTFTPTQSQVNQTLQVVASYTDGQGRAESVTSKATTAVANVNDTPAGSVTISGTSTQGQTLTAAHTLADLDGLGTISYQWKANGTAIIGATGSTYTLGQAEVGKTISVIASYTDGFGAAENVSSAATAAVANTNDAPTGTVSVTGTVQQGQTLTASHTLADADGMGTVSYQWLLNGANIPNATSSTLGLTQQHVGKTISVQATYTDSYGQVESVISTAATVVNLNDIPTGSVSIAGIATQGQTLTASNTLADVDGLGSVTYQWLADGQAIVGATGSTFVLGQAQVGKAIRVTASYTDAQGTAEAVTSAVTEEVANINDAPTGSVTINGTPTQGETLTAASTLADTDGLDELEYQWLADGVAIAGANDADYSPTQAEVGKTISVTVGYTDMQGTAESVTSGATAAVANTNDEPTGGVAISGAATQGQTLTATHTLADADGLGTVTYQWLSDGNTIAGATGNTLVLGQAQVGHFISVKAQYTDGFGAVEQVQSTATQAVVNVNELPTGNVTITGTATQGQTLSATHTLADTDGLGALKYQWLADGVAITGATGSTFRLKQAQVDKVVSVRISYTDAQGTAESVTSAETAAVANVNDAPTGTVTLTGTAAQNQTLTVTNNLADVDGMGTVSYQWLANGAVLEGVTGTSLTLNQALVGKTISVQARYTDGFGTEEAKTSRVTAAVTNVNDAPTGSVTINGTATQGQTLTASHTLADADGLGVLKYQWLANGVAIAGATGSSLMLAQAHVGKAIRVQVKYTDGFGTQQTVQSTATELIANTNDAPTFSNLPVASQPVFAGYASALNDFKVADPDSGTLLLTVQANNGTVKGLIDADTSADGIQLSGTAASLNKALAVATFVAADIGPASLALTLSDGTALPVTATYAMQAGFKATNGDAADNTLSGGAGMDQLSGNDGNDNLNGGAGKDKLLGGNGNDTLNGGAGVDTMTGGLGDDTYYVDAAGDVVNESNDAANGGTDTVFSSVTRTLGAFQENLILTGVAALNGTGNTLNNVLTGNAGANKLTGNAGNDVLTGGMGKDVLSGGAGADTFVFNAAAESTGTTKDTILDFVAGTDQIDLRGMDANALTTGSNDAFTFIGKAAFSSTNATGQLRFSYSAAGNFVVVSGSTDADVEAEFSVQLNGISNLTAADFLL